MSRQHSSATNSALLALALAVALLLLFAAKATAVGRGEALRYWTPQRMASARPLDLVLDRGGEPRLRLGRAPQPAATASFAGVPEPAAPPYSFNGRLFIRVGARQGYCSATAIDSPTAAGPHRRPLRQRRRRATRQPLVPRPPLRPRLRDPRPARGHLRPLLLAAERRQAGRRALSAAPAAKRSRRRAGGGSSGSRGARGAGCRPAPGGGGRGASGRSC